MTAHLTRPAGVRYGILGEGAPLPAKAAPEFAPLAEGEELEDVRARAERHELRTWIADFLAGVDAEALCA